MVRLPALAAALLVCSGCAPPGPPAVADPIPYVSPLMGTGGFAYFHGSVFPGACVPHGLVKVGPDTRGPLYGELSFIHYAGYWAGDDTALGFSHLHLHGTGAMDWGAVVLQPVTATDESVLSREGYLSKFSKRSERATPGSYALTLQRWGVRAELTASTHAAHHRYTAEDGGTPAVVLDLVPALGGGRVSRQVLQTPDDTTVRGSLHVDGPMGAGYGGNDVYFELKTNRPYTVAQRADGGTAAVLAFASGPQVEVMVGLSLVSAQGAATNLAAELPTFDFDAHQAAAADAWRARLSKITVYGGSDEDRATFYSALRLPFLMPTTISDVDGRYVYGGRAGQVPSGEAMVSDLSLWDTYRTTHPLYGLLFHDSARDSANSLLRMAKDGRGLPRWPMAGGETGTMVGAPADIVLADAVLRGVPGVDGEAAWQQASTEALQGDLQGSRLAQRRFTTLGYVPSEDSFRSVGLTVEYAHADFALAGLGQKLGHGAEADRLAQRSHGWQRLFDPTTQVLRPHTADGAASPAPYVLDGWDHYAEATGLQTTFMPAAWDLPGFDTVFGSRARFLEALTAFFDAAPGEEATQRANPTWEFRWLPRTYFWASNEPDLHTPFVFAQAGQPALTAKWSDWARRTFFSAAPDGLPGNDDGGTLGAWFVFAAIGLYPVPGTEQWIVGSPLFPKVALALPNGRTFTIEAQGVSAQNVYVQSATLRGRRQDTAVLTHEDVLAGGALVLTMGPKPSAWGQ